MILYADVEYSLLLFLFFMNHTVLKINTGEQTN